MSLRNEDLIVVHVSGSRGPSKATQVVAARFNGAGDEINDQGTVMGGRPKLPLPDSIRAGAPGQAAGGGPSAIPEFDVAKYITLQKAGDFAGVKRLQLEHARAVAAAEANGGGDVRSIVARAVIDYCKSQYGASEQDVQDNNVLVIKPENVDVSVFRAPNEGPLTYTVTGTAVYGR